MRIVLEVSEGEVEGILGERLEKVVRELHGVAIAERVRFREVWRFAEEIGVEFGISERHLRQLVEDGKVGKSQGLSPRLTLYFRPDLVDLVEKGHVKSRRRVAEELAEGRKVVRLDAVAGEVARAPGRSDAGVRSRGGAQAAG